MNRRRFFCAVAACLALCSSRGAFAEEAKLAPLLQTLPADGAWSTLSVTVKVDGQEFVVTGTVRSVGRSLHGGKPCRFIEYEQTVENPPAIDVPQLGNLTFRMLVPEEEFGVGKDPLSKAVKRWVKIEKLEPEVVESLELRDPIFAILLQGPRKNLKTEDAKEKVSWQRGELDCTVVTGQNELEVGVVKLKMDLRVFQHAEVPFGIAGLHQDLKASFGGQEYDIAIRVSLRDYGTDAKAKLPELVP